ncbi:MAG: hypothetical protein LBV67_09480 [Streptococcaceae bacterium]|jgi:hypothetical protein|nr:hypothetical protein [Streptococcaceae bacterium]
MSKNKLNLDKAYQVLHLIFPTGKIIKVLDTMDRVHTDEIPNGVHRYGIRDADTGGDYAQIKHFVLVNHATDILTVEPLPLNQEKELYFLDKEDADFKAGSDYVDYQYVSEMLSLNDLLTEIKEKEEKHYV